MSAVMPAFIWGVKCVMILMILMMNMRVNVSVIKMMMVLRRIINMMVMKAMIVQDNVASYPNPHELSRGIVMGAGPVHSDVG